MNKKNILIVVLLLIIVVVTAIILVNVKKEAIPTTNSNTEQAFSIKYKDVEVVPGTEFNADAINAEADFSEIPSCAFEGTDKMYTYDNVEIIATEIDGKNKVYQVYFIDDTISTSEGVKITDSKDLMIEKYGNEYEEKLGSKYVYTKNNVELSFMIENDIITGIEYTLKTDN